MARLRPLLVSLAAACALGFSPAPVGHAVSGVGGVLGIGFLGFGDGSSGDEGTGVSGFFREAHAKDLAALHRDLSSGADFRLRVSAALSIGQMGQKSSVPHLVKALDDVHPAVRAASSAALGKLGDRSAIVPLDAAASREAVATVKNQHMASLARLRGSNAAVSSPVGAKFVVKLGTLANRTGVRSPEVDRMFRDATRKHMARIPGALVPGEREDATSVGRARSLPVVGVDGSISKLNTARSGADVGWDAQVEYLVKQMPQQQLKSTIKGRGKALANAAAVRGPSEQTQLQTDAVNAAVESALGDAGRALTAATN